jgi:trimeric autotransporter adhesin
MTTTMTIGAARCPGNGRICREILPLLAKGRYNYAWFNHQTEEYVIIAPTPVLCNAMAKLIENAMAEAKKRHAAWVTHEARQKADQKADEARQEAFKPRTKGRKVVSTTSAKDGAKAAKAAAEAAKADEAANAAEAADVAQYGKWETAGQRKKTPVAKTVVTKSTKTATTRVVPTTKTATTAKTGSKARMPMRFENPTAPSGAWGTKAPTPPATVATAPATVATATAKSPTPTAAKSPTPTADELTPPERAELVRLRAEKKAADEKVAAEKAAAEAAATENDAWGASAAWGASDDDE